MPNPLRAYAVLCSTLALLICAGSAGAQVWPTKPVRLVVPFAPGGIADTMARFTAPMLQSALGQTVLVESKPGANGSLGTEYVAKSAPDGHTLLIGLAAPQT
ncbi:MAG: hypothetical protein GEV05_12980 [Betaproteobacteria bacterium]|nr:hypothetical protein [Betaproteobacteria bacterium]